MGNSNKPLKCDFIKEEYDNNKANMIALYIVAGFYFFLLIQSIFKIY